MHDVRLMYVPKKLEPDASHPTGSEAGFSLACNFDIPAMNASGVKMALVVPISSSTEKLYLEVSAIQWHRPHQRMSTAGAHAEVTGLLVYSLHAQATLRDFARTS